MPRPPCPYTTGTAQPSYSFEFFPPLTQPGTLNLQDRIHRMSSLSPGGPAAISVTWGAGGSTSERSMSLAEFISKELRNGKDEIVQCMLHLTCTNMERSKVVETLDTAQALGIKNILALRGDPPRDAEYAPAQVTPICGSDQPFVYASDLVSFIRKNYGDAFCIGVAGYPDPHPDSLSPEEDIRFLKSKVDAGADFILTQLFYDVDVFLGWSKRCRAAGITVPIIPGVMPIQNFSSFRRMTTLCKATVPQSLLDCLEPIKHDDIQVKTFGVNLAVSMCKRLIEEGKVEGIHFCTLNLEKSVRRVLDGLGLIRDEPAVEGGWKVCPEDVVPCVSRTGLWPVADQLSSTTKTQIPEITLSSSRALQEATTNLTLQQEAIPLASTTAQNGTLTAVGKIPEGESWDEFPNGRFTDPRSPAYGELDGYGAGLKILPHEALTCWGAPSSPESISELFTSYLQNSIPSIPWCTSPLERESLAILPLLLKLNSPEKGWWTVGSQPAVDGAPSEDRVYGFGPRGGYIFQKSFVEFFVKEEEVREIERKAKSLEGVVKFYAGNQKGDFLTNMEPTEVNAVTWAIFPGQEIVQSTIIEEISFRSWKDEAFSIWNDWSYLYPTDSPSRALLQQMAEDRWLVSLVHHDFKDPDGLERFLMG